MLLYLLILLLALPFVDLYLLMKLSGVIGFWKTLAVVIGTGVVGAWLVRREFGFVAGKLGASVTAGELSRNSLEALMLFAAGVALITPGLVTDALGFLLVVRPVRERLVVRLSRKLKDRGNVKFEVARF